MVPPSPTIKLRAWNHPLPQQTQPISIHPKPPSILPPSHILSIDKWEGVEVDLIIIIYKMQNNQNQGLSKCEHHLFSLKPLQKDRRPNLSVSVSLCRAKPAKGKKNNRCGCFEGARLNLDRSHATPAFVLPSQAADYLVNGEQFLRDHQKKVREYEQPASQVWVPKPRSKNMYCNVCREGYTEYLEHIRLYTHRANVRACPFNNCILELQATFRGTEQRDLGLSSTETGLNSVPEEEEGEGVGVRGRKRVKGGVGAGGSPPADTYQHCTFTGSTQNGFYPQGSFPAPMDLWSRLASCRAFYTPTVQFAPYVPAMTMQGGMGMGGMGVPGSYLVYCMPMNATGAEWFPRQE